MAKWTNFYKIVEPKPSAVKVSDNQTIGDQGAYGNFSWYQRLVQGSASRLTRYREYDLMDADVIVSRALDTLAEEITGNIEKHEDCLEVWIDDEYKEEIDDTIVQTLKVSLKYWIKIYKLKTRLFKLSRTLLKYGDCFFEKQQKEDLNSVRWTYIHPKNIIGALVDENDVTKVLGWQIKEDEKKVKSSYGVPVSNTSSTIETRLITSEQLLRFTLNDDMSDAAPFGDSVLGPVYRAHKQKQLIEDAIIIYRIQRAPERRVFYIDVGRMHPQRVKTYLENIKNEIKQKKVPNIHGGQSNVDSVYSPQAMNEDFFFAVRENGRGSKVETLPGGQNLGELTDLEYFQNKVWEGLKIPVSYMRENGESSSWNDGKVGVAYIKEMRFALYIQRLQGYIEEVIDAEFKQYIRKKNINIDENLYSIVLPEPSNFGKYRQQEVDAAILGIYGSADAIPYISKRFALSKYLQLTDDEIIMNETLLKEERGIDPEAPDTETVKDMYSIPLEGEAGMGAGGAIGGELPMTAGGDLAGEMGEEGGEAPLGTEGPTGGAETVTTPPTV